MILESVKNGPLIWPSIKENRVTRPKKYYELSATEAIQADCDVNAINIILQGLPLEDLHTTNIDQLHAYLGQHEFHANEVHLMHERNSDPLDLVATHQMTQITLQPVQGRQISFASGTSRTYTPGTSGINYGTQMTVTCYNYKGEGHMSKQCTKPKRKRDDLWFKDKELMVQAQANGQILHEEELAFLADPGITEVALMANLSHYGSNALAEVHNLDTVDTNIINQVVHAMPSSEPSNEIVQNSNSSAQQDALILYKAQQLEPKLYDGNVIEKTSAIVIPDFEETLILAEESQLTLSSRPTIVEVPKELPKVSMVNTSLKKLKHHLAGFDVVVKERTTTTAITEGSWGFKHTKACFRDEIIPFVKALKELFNTFYQYLINELKVQNVFHQMEQAVEQHRLESKTFEVKMNKVLNENERLLEQVISKDIVNIIVNSSVNNTYAYVHECENFLKLETELLNKKDFIEKETYDKLENSISNQSDPSFDHYFILNELKAQSQEKDTVISKLKERIKSLSGNMKKDKIKKDLEEIETINIELDHRVSKLIARNEHLKQTYKQLSLKDDLWKLKGKALANDAVNSQSIAPEMLNVDVEPLAPKLLNNRTVHSNYLRHTQEQATILREDMNARVKSKSVMQNIKRKVWKPTGKVFTNIRYTWRPTGQTFTIVGNACPLTMITTITEVPFRKPIVVEIDTPKPVVTLVYSRKPRKSKSTDPISKSKVGISHEIFVACSPQQNGVVERRNRTLIEAAHTMLIYAKAPLFLLAEAVFTACYTQNCSIVRLHHSKTPYKLLHDKLPDLSFFHVFVALEPAASTGSPSSTTVDQDAPLPSISQTTPETQSPIILNDVEKDNHDLDVAHMNNDPFFGIPIPEVPSDQSLSTDIIHKIVHLDH
uniref:Putative ribonuclease H-like domain-containing protein n=1 Tax=Tanacetum cinerariifolium TaxID=118510 RepID=A0A6L2LU74_TANCI|nr:putative ribonuclease H-like domain-containing protein [Tanacetum cinerariifolium]